MYWWLNGVKLIKIVNLINEPYQDYNGIDQKLYYYKYIIIKVLVCIEILCLVKNFIINYIKTLSGICLWNRSNFNIYFFNLNINDSKKILIETKIKVLSYF